ncbi:MAG: hypothetical protein C0403_19805 [Desulfobacterium sp.]|nr:hypothetical protein [Desulfobacterium sp.]
MGVIICESRLSVNNIAYAMYFNFLTYNRTSDIKRYLKSAFYHFIFYLRYFKNKIKKMTQKIKIQPAKKYLHVEICGNFTTEEAKQSFRQVIVESKKNDLWKILLDCRSFESDLIINRYEFGNEIMDAKSRPIQIAIVLPKQHVLSIQSIEKVALNWWGSTKITITIEQALEWLGV